MKICINCGKKFDKGNLPKHLWMVKKYCCRICKIRAQYKTHKEKYIKRAKKRYYENRKEELKKQGERIKKRYHQDEDYKKLYNKRRVSAHKVSLKNKKCEICGIQTDLQRHHPDYKNMEKVIILCRKCHNHAPRSQVTLAGYLIVNHLS